MTLNKQTFVKHVLRWYQRHGRTNLPWQQTPYGVWVSEIMLQQTQVKTVIAYYRRFMARFPDIEALATADLDDVMQQWAGLGYYARARNLHQAAQLICKQHAGRFPQEFDTVLALPGIGRSTAGAILSFACNQSHTILDGNIKRVLARYHGVAGWPGQTAVAKELWAHACALTPQTQVAQYNQAMMDLGATLCTRHNPNCEHCPIKRACKAHAQGRQSDYPGTRPNRKLPVKQASFLLLLNSKQEILLERRPPTGIWGGLWSFPELGPGQSVVQWCQKQLGADVEQHAVWPVRRHTFSHFHLDIKPIVLLAKNPGHCVMEESQRVWYKVGQPLGGMATPVEQLLNLLIDKTVNIN